MKNFRWLLLAAIAGAFAGCEKSPSAKIDTGKVYGAAELPPGSFKPDTTYGEVNSAWLAGFYERWRADIFEKGVTKWEGRFDCNKFAAAFCASAQLEYYRDNFHSWTPGQALAVAEVWYRPDKGGAHAIVVAMTERGPVYVEPQTGKELALTESEKRSVYFQRF